MPIVFHITVTDLAKEYFPNAIVRKSGNIEMITFTWYQIIFRQAKISGIWRSCNQYHLKPIAKTFFGRISSIKIIH